MQYGGDGIIIIDKPAGITSATLVARLKKITGARKAGHTGTLDPFATGVMVCCFNRATRLARFFLAGDKTYEALLYLGKETDTQDSTGKVISVCKDTEFSDGEIRHVFTTFEGPVEQTPPIYSSLKHKGMPLHKLARQGRPVEKPPRRIMIHYLKILDIDLPEIHFEVSCSSGTYIRTLCVDIGKKLGCGGHLKSLRRIESCGFSTRQALSLEEVDALAARETLSEKIISMADAMAGLPGYVADEALSKKIISGQKITGKDVEHMSSSERNDETLNNFIKITDKENHLLAILEENGGTGQYDYCCVFPKSQY